MVDEKSPEFIAVHHDILQTFQEEIDFEILQNKKMMGVDEIKLAESLQGIIAQRLVRRLCPHCKKQVSKDKLDPRLLQTFAKMGYPKPEVFKPEGCNQCSYTGFKGRIGVYEILLLDHDIKDALYQQASISELRNIARQKGFRNLFEDALSLVAEGITNYKEVLRVIQQDLSVVPKKAQKPVETPSEMAKPVSKQASEKQVPSAKKIKRPGSLDEIKKLAKQFKQEKAVPPKRKAASKPSVVPQKPKTEAVDILVVEDYPVTRLLLKRMLERQKNWKVRGAADGLKGLDAIKQHIPDIILLDLMMPNMDGYEFLKHLRSNPKGEEVPVLIITSMNGSEDELKGFELGADDFITKPINMNLLVARIKRHLHHDGLNALDNEPPVMQSKPKTEPNPKVLASSQQEVPSRADNEIGINLRLS